MAASWKALFFFLNVEAILKCVYDYCFYLVFSSVRCPADFTVDIRGFIQWPMALVHRTVEVECQFGGKATRKCIADERSPNRPRWKYPDTSSCESVRRAVHSSHQFFDEVTNQITIFLFQVTKMCCIIQLR